MIRYLIKIFILFLSLILFFITCFNYSKKQNTFCKVLDKASYSYKFRHHFVLKLQDVNTGEEFKKDVDIFTYESVEKNDYIYLIVSKIDKSNTHFIIFFLLPLIIIVLISTVLFWAFLIIFLSFKL